MQLTMMMYWNWNWKLKLKLKLKRRRSRHQACRFYFLRNNYSQEDHEPTSLLLSIRISNLRLIERKNEELISLFVIHLPVQIWMTSKFKQRKRWIRTHEAESIKLSLFLRIASLKKFRLL